MLVHLDVLKSCALVSKLPAALLAELLSSLALHPKYDGESVHHNLVSVEPIGWLVLTACPGVRHEDQPQLLQGLKHIYKKFVLLAWQ